MSNSARNTFDDPFTEQRVMRELLSQETRHLVVQCLLGHPHHLMSLAEFAHMIQKNEGAILDQLHKLRETGLIDVYVREQNESARDLPSRFWGPTERGVEVLYEHNYLRGVPVARAVYDETRKSEKVERHENAPRPTIPTAVDEALAFDEPVVDV
jgi:DNA-binding PadR family transcriptional regulator